MANLILEKFEIKMTVRQLYYQMVAADFIPNSVKSYRRVVRILRDGRLAGLVDWNWIEDRLRIPRTPSTWNSIKSIVNAAKDQFRGTGSSRKRIGRGRPSRSRSMTDEMLRGCPEKKVARRMASSDGPGTTWDEDRVSDRVEPVKTTDFDGSDGCDRWVPFQW